MKVIVVPMRTVPSLTGVIVLAIGSVALAKPPSVERLFPAGGQRGASAKVTASGSFDHWPVRGWADAAGIRIEAEKEKGKLSITVAADVAPGIHWIRLYDDEGGAPLRPFVVGTLPEVVETESGDDAQTLGDAHVTVNGVLGRRGDVDAFAFRLAKGETLVASVDANTHLGAPMDAVLQVATSGGIVLAQNDDTHGLDPQIVFDVPADATYHVRIFAFPAVPDASIAFAGGAAFVYRLTLTSRGFLEYAFPLAVPRADPGRVEAHGWNVPEEAKQLAVTGDALSETTSVGHPSLAGSAEVRLESHPATLEHEPNDGERPEALALPVTISGRIAPARDRDAFAFAAKKGAALGFRVEARALGSPLDPVLRVTDSAGATISEVDDTTRRGGRDAELTFRPPADGSYRLVVRDLHDQGGDRYVYRLTAAAPEADFRLTMATDRYMLSPGKPLSIPVNVERTNGFDGVVEVCVDGLPGAVTAAAVRSDPKGKSARTVTLEMIAEPGRPSSSPFRVIGKVMSGPVRQRLAQVPIAGFDRPATWSWLTVRAVPGEKPKPR